MVIRDEQDIRSLAVDCNADQTPAAWKGAENGMNDWFESFAACKNHISLYIDQAVIERIRPQLNEFAIKKNAIYLAYNRALPIQAIEDLIRQCFESV